MVPVPYGKEQIQDGKLMKKVRYDTGDYLAYRWL
jgi:hypothetical protein